MRSLLVRQAPIFSPDGGFAPEVPRARRTNPVAALFLAWDARHRMRMSLKDLPDHLLQDIGLTRDQARRESGKPFWRP